MPVSILNKHQTVSRHLRRSSSHLNELKIVVNDRFPPSIHLETSNLNSALTQLDRAICALSKINSNIVTALTNENTATKGKT